MAGKPRTGGSFSMMLRRAKEAEERSAEERNKLFQKVALSQEEGPDISPGQKPETSQSYAAKKLKKSDYIGPKWEYLVQRHPARSYRDKLNQKAEDRIFRDVPDHHLAGKILEHDK